MTELKLKIFCMAITVVNTLFPSLDCFLHTFAYLGSGNHSTKLQFQWRDLEKRTGGDSQYRVSESGWIPNTKSGFAVSVEHSTCHMVYSIHILLFCL